MHADEVQVRSDLVRYESGGQPRTVQAPVHQAHGNEMPLVVLADGADKMLDPLAGYIGPGMICLIQSDDLGEVLAAKSWSQPIAIISFPSWHHGLVHEVIAEDGRAVLASAGYSLPKAGLHIPAIL